VAESHRRRLVARDKHAFGLQHFTEGTKLHVREVGREDDSSLDAFEVVIVGPETQSDAFGTLGAAR
jgi:hypothetical protein